MRSITSSSALVLLTALLALRSATAGRNMEEKQEGSKGPEGIQLSFKELQKASATGGESYNPLKVESSSSSKMDRGVHGDDARYPVHCQEMQEHPWNLIGCLSSSESTDNCMCTAALFGEKMIVTAIHCITEGVDSYFIPGACDDQAPYGAFRIEKYYYYVSEQDMEHEVRAFDFATAMLESHPSGLGYMGYAMYEDWMTEYEWGNLGYPGDKSEDWDTFADEPYYNSGVILGSVTKNIEYNGNYIYNDLIYHCIDAWGGQSGSPIFGKGLNHGESYDIIGVHVAGIREIDMVCDADHANKASGGESFVHIMSYTREQHM